jgi:hypothetical protein
MDSPHKVRNDIHKLKKVLLHKQGRIQGGVPGVSDPPLKNKKKERKKKGRKEGRERGEWKRVTFSMVPSDQHSLCELFRQLKYNKLRRLVKRG